MTIIVTRTEKAKKDGESIGDSHPRNDNRRWNTSSNEIQSKFESIIKKLPKEQDELDINHDHTVPIHVLKHLNLGGLSQSVVRIHIYPPYFIVIAKLDILIYSTIDMFRLFQSDGQEFMQDSFLEPIIQLKSHSQSITQSHVYLNSKFHTILISCCKEKIILWDIDAIANQEIDKGNVLSQNIGEVIALDEYQYIIAIGLSDCILLLDSKEMVMLNEIQLTKSLKDCLFMKDRNLSKTKSMNNIKTKGNTLSRKFNTQLLNSSNSGDTHLFESKIILIAEGDGTISIWNCENVECLWKSPRETGFGFIRHALSLDLVHPKLLSIACSDGVIKNYEFSVQSYKGNKPYYKQISSLPEMFVVFMKFFNLDPLTGERKSKIKSEFQINLKSQDPIWKQQSDFLRKMHSIQSIKNLDQLKLCLNTILFISHVKCYKKSFLCVGTPRAFFLFDMQTLDALYILDQGEEKEATAYSCISDLEDEKEILRVYIAYDKFVDNVDIQISQLLDIDLSTTNPIKIQSVKQESIEKIKLNNDNVKNNSENKLSSSIVDNLEENRQNVDIQSDELSIFANGKLPSKLLIEFNSKPTKQKTKIKDKPVTFHSKIKSSGYGTELPFAYQKKVTKKSITQPKLSNEEKEYPIDSSPPVQDAGFKKQIHNAPVLAMSLSNDGQKLATCSSDNSARVFRFPLSKSEASCFMQHSNAVTDVKWSLTKKYIITSSLDCQAILWTVDRTEPILSISHLVQNSPKKEQPPTHPFKHPIKNAQFYYQDKFVMLSTSNNLHLFRYYIAPQEKDQILQKGFNRNRYKLLLTYKSDAQTFTALSGINSFTSHLTFLGGSNRSLHIFDISKEKVVRITEDAHTRPITKIILNEFPASNQNAVVNPHQLFATIATDESIRLWDLRTSRCIRQFTGHKNSVHSIGGSFSPCMRYFVCGSEDRYAYIYDLGSGSVISKLSGHTETVSDALFHPQKPMVITSSYDNTIKMFTI